MIHTYVLRGGKWLVLFYGAAAAPTVLRTYNTEAQAAAWASYLNGGNLPLDAAYGSPP